MSIASIQISLNLFFATNMEITTFYNGMVKSACGIVACFPQYVLIYQLKSTKGFSILAQILDIIACLSAILQIVVDYYAYGNGTGFWNELNWGKFLTCWASIAGVSVFLFQHQYYKYFYKSAYTVVTDIPGELNMTTESKDIFGIGRNRLNSDQVLRRISGKISFHENSDLGVGGSQTITNFEKELTVLPR